MPKERKVADDRSADNVDDPVVDDNQDDVTQVTRRVDAGRQAIDDQSAVDLENRRVHAIEQLAEANSIGDETVKLWVQRGYSLDQVADNILQIHKQRGESGASRANLGLSENEVREYSICRAILAAHSGKWDDAGFELECHKAVEGKVNKVVDKGTFFVPLDVQRRAMPFGAAQLAHIARTHGVDPLQVMRDLNVATPGAGGFLTQTTNVGFDELMRNISFAFRMGVMRLSGLRDNVAIPRQSSSGAWASNNTAEVARRSPIDHLVTSNAPTTPMAGKPNLPYTRV